jgi:nitrate/TMAO reductase-like tetraheme cytochrome c subunit
VRYSASLSDAVTPSSVPAPRPGSVWRNWITLAGVIVAAGSVFAFLLLLTLDLTGKGGTSPYLGILSYLVAPSFLFLGLAMILTGAWLERKRRIRSPNAPAPRVAIDMARPRDRRILAWFVAGSMGFLLLTAVGSYQTFQYTESVPFCGEVCHTVMEPEFTTYKHGSHARVACVECHIGSGAAWFVKAKLSGLHQVYAVALNKYDRPIPAPVKDLRPARDTCLQCHWPEKYSGSIERTERHFLSDKANTPYTVRMLVHVGGGSAQNGPVGGIHWHMLVSNKVEYAATDNQRQTIPWIRQTAADGTVTVFRTDDFKGEPDPKSIRRMDCMDCHNRPAHKYSSPNDAVDEALYLGRIDKSLPSVKRTVVDLLTKPYPNAAAAAAALDQGLRKQFAAVPNLDATIAAAQAIYRENFFPEMKADWSKYPDNIGHLDSAGCFRCHDGKHVAASGAKRAITNDCNTCHTILAQGAGAELAALIPEGAAFRHPSMDIGGMGLQCVDCHNGKNQAN